MAHRGRVFFILFLANAFRGSSSVRVRVRSVVRARTQLGGGFFVAGSTLFFPAMAEIIYHGGWLYITGCVLTLAGALLAMLTSFEMKRTALPLQFRQQPPPCVLLPSWTDEGATIASCSLYVAGNLIFITGSVCFFPRVIEIGGVAIEVYSPGPPTPLLATASLKEQRSTSRENRCSPSSSSSSAPSSSRRGR